MNINDTKQLHFEVIKNPYKFEKELTIFYKENNEIFIAKEVVFEKYDRSTQFDALFTVYDEDLKRLSKELYADNSEEANYLKGSLEATKNHLKDMQSLVFKTRK